MIMTEEKKRRALELAEDMAEDFDEEQADRFSEKHSDKNWIGKFRLLFQMISDRDFSLGPATWAIIAGAIAYVVFPADAIPDFIPGLGWIDDVFVLTVVNNRLARVIEDYKAFRKRKLGM